MTSTTTPAIKKSTLTKPTQRFIDDLESAFAESNKDFARAYYLFATARLEKNFNSTEIFDKYPLLTNPKTFKKIQALFDKNPENGQIRRLFTSVLEFYVNSQLSVESDALENARNALTVNTGPLGLTRDDGKKEVESLLYEDIPEWLKKLTDRDKRLSLYHRMSKAYSTILSPQFISLFHAQNKLMSDLGYSDIIEFYSKTSGHDLNAIGKTAKKLLKETEDIYTPLISEFYKKRTGLEINEATRADIAYVFSGPSKETRAIDSLFPKSRLVRLAEETFDQMGLGFSSVAKTVNFKSKGAYTEALNTHHKRFTSDDVEQSEGLIWLDIANRPGKNARAYVYPAVFAKEVYLSVKPEGGLDDYSAFLHESGHALHFAFEDRKLSYSDAMLGNNSTTEAYAYLFQNLLLNRYWLTKVAGLPKKEASLAVRLGALNDLYMLRRYCSKLLFELKLFKGDASEALNLKNIPNTYKKLLTAGTLFSYDAEGWSRDVDAGFYVADYFTAWTLEAQLREYLANHFGTKKHHGEDWFSNPKAGAFLRKLWAKGNIDPDELSKALGFKHPNDTKPLKQWLTYNLEA